MPKRDYYQILGVERDASSDDLRRAYRAFAMKHHPDRNPGNAESEALFKEATEAYSVLSDEAKRARYDRFGHEGVEGGGGAQGDIFSHFQDLFSEFFGGFGGGRGGGQRRGENIRVQERLSLREAVYGCKREVVLRVPTPCEGCEGSGAAKGSSVKRCPTCEGAGQVTTARGFVMFTQTCPRCSGRGASVDNPCEKCRGGGLVEKTKKVTVAFPAGIDGGQQLRVPGQGVAIAGGQAGDLYVDVEVEGDERFEREQLDLLTRVQVSFAAAATGTRLALELLDGSPFEVDVPAGTQPGDVISFKGKGVPRLDGRGKGALHVLVQVQVPRKLSDRARQLLIEFDAELQAIASAPQGGGATGA